MSKTTIFFSGLLRVGLLWILILLGGDLSYGQSFSQNQVDFNGHATVQSGTSLSFGPDGKLYVTEYPGEVKIYTLERESPGAYKVLDVEILTDIQEIAGYNDDGTRFASTFRETIGLAVAGTAENPVFYVSSSDFRIGGGGGGGSGDIGLDTNSGVITRFTWNGEFWEVVDIVRGLPRSEENHATNGMEYVVVNGEEYLLVAQGGNTNAGGPSANFAYTTEYALSAAVLSVNLSMLQAMPIQDDAGRKYIYDLPTLDDPSRPNKNGINNPDEPGYDGVDVNDPWGGNDGLNQAVIVPGGPVQIFSPGYRNTFDLVVTESGAVYVTDNGANGGWGGFPENEGLDGTATNNYLPTEPGSSIPIEGEKINNKDHLSVITKDIHSYSFGSFYGGHPNPIRANPAGAGLYTNPAQTGTEGAVFRTLIYHPEKNSDGFTMDPDVGLPANWPPVQIANPVEGDWRGPGIENPDGPNDELITTWGTNTNAITEYTASNFDGMMQGNLLAGVNTGELRRVELEADGSLKTLHSSFISGLGGDALGVTSNGDDAIFPGTIWVVTLNGKLLVLEPQDFVVCILPGDAGYDPQGDNDFDGYTNQDEIDNGSDPCNGGSQPSDFDKEVGGVLVSDLTGPDDDNDGILDHEDPFQLGNPLEGGSDAFELPVINELFSSNPDLKGFMGLGMTGLMNNGEQGPNWLLWLDRRDDSSEPNPNDILGGAIGAMTMQMTAGTALGESNNQEKGFQYGVQVDQYKGEFIVSGGMVNFHDPLQLYGNVGASQGELGIFIGDGFQGDYIKFVLNQAGLVVQQEMNDVPGQPLIYPIAVEERPNGGITFYLIVDPVTGQVDFEFRKDNGARHSIGSMTVSGNLLQALQSSKKDLAVGLIGTSNQEGVEVEGTWDFLNVTPSGPFVVQVLEDVESEVDAEDVVIDLSQYFTATMQESLEYEVYQNSNQQLEVSVLDSLLTIAMPSAALEAEITIQASDAQGRHATQQFAVKVRELIASQVLYRINAGGPHLGSLDGEMDWTADTRGNNSEYLSESGNNMTYSGGVTQYAPFLDLDIVPESIFATERYDNSPGAPNMTYSFPVPEPGLYEIRLYLGDGFSGTSQPGSRIFDVKVEGTVSPSLEAIDLSQRFGSMVGGMISETVEVTDGILDIEFVHGVQNPLINGIEILGGSEPMEGVIVIEPILDQLNYPGDQMDGSLVVHASGGDGNLSYSMSGQPQGIVIEPTNGLLSGTIGVDAVDVNPYTVVITVDDSDEINTDAVSVSFAWTIESGQPKVIDQLPDITRSVGSDEEVIDLTDYFDDDKGVDSLEFSIEENSDAALGVAVDKNWLTLTYPTEPTTSVVTVLATDQEGYSVEQRFEVTVVEESVSLVLYRINAGGPSLPSIDGEMDWEADTRGGNSEYLVEAARNMTYSGKINSYAPDVDLSKIPPAVFKTERYDDLPGPPNMKYTFPVPQIGDYEVRLYMGDGFAGTAAEGARIFDVKLEGSVLPALENIDLSNHFGSMVGGVISQVVEVQDGFLDMEFLHVIQNPLVNAIEILSATEGNQGSIQVGLIPDQTSFVGEELDGSLKVNASGGQGNLNYSMSGAPEGILIDPVSGAIYGTIASEANYSSPYVVSILVEDMSEDGNQAATIEFNWVVNNLGSQSWEVKGESTNYTPRHENSFVQAGDRFYLMGGRENARTLDVYDYSTDTWTSLLNSAPVEFNHFQATQYEGLIWIIGAFKTNNYPREEPADYIWAFNPGTQDWIQGPEIPQSRRRGSAGLVVHEGKFYIVGGNTVGHDGGYVSWFDEYDPVTGTWTPLEDAPRARDHFHAAVIDGKLYAVGGRLSGGPGGSFRPLIPEVDVYDFQTGSWSTLSSDLPTPRGGAAVANFKNQLVVIGGEVEQELVYGKLRTDALEITEAYDPQTGLWSRWGDLNYKRHGTQAIVSGEGLFTIAGSPNKGGGNQKHMEVLGMDAPIGISSIPGTLQMPDSLHLTEGVEESLVIQNINGNTGILLKSIQVLGTDADDFKIVSGDFSNIMLPSGASLEIGILFQETNGMASANLHLYYGTGEFVTIALVGRSADNATQNQNRSGKLEAELIPNPVKNEALLMVDPELDIDAIQIHSYNGSLIRSFQPKATFLGHGQFKLNFGDLPSGMYFVKVSSRMLRQTLQFIKK